MTFNNIINKYNFIKTGISYNLKFKKIYILTLISDDKSIEIKLFKYDFYLLNNYTRLYFYNLYREIYKTDNEICTELDLIINKLLNQYDSSYIRKLKYKKLNENT